MVLAASFISVHIHLPERVMSVEFHVKCFPSVDLTHLCTVNQMSVVYFFVMRRVYGTRSDASRAFLPYSDFFIDDGKLFFSM